MNSTIPDNELCHWVIELAKEGIIVYHLEILAYSKDDARNKFQMHQPNIVAETLIIREPRLSERMAPDIDRSFRHIH